MNLSRVSRTLLAESAAPTQKATPPSPAMNGDVFVQRPKPIRAIQWSLGLPVDF